VTSVLVVDDDPRLLRALRITLHARGYQVTVATDGSNALAAAAEHHPDIILLDLGLPDLDGVDIIHALRGWTTVPVIVLSGRAGSGDKIAALDAGADDYVTKPFRVDELLARLRAVARRSPPPSEPLAVPLGDHLIDLDARRVTREPGPPSGCARRGAPAEVRLTPTEWHLLDILLRNPEKLLTYRDLLPRVGGPAPREQAHYLRQYIGRLRRKLEPDPAQPRHLITEPGIGYRFQP
jgi:two-component system KDP operon response regulator KdpE